jgi:uncharacterized protein (DUF1810 family)
MPDPHDLQRFIDAQDPLYHRVVEELSRGRKASHWMWFIFPQVAGLGFSAMAQRYAIRSRDEAQSYLAHDILGPRLQHCAELVCAVRGKTFHDILGAPDDAKFRSSMTLFKAVSDRDIFARALIRFYDGDDAATLAILAGWDA